MYCSTGRMHRDSPCSEVRIRKDVAEQTLVEIVRTQELSATASELEAQGLAEDDHQRKYGEAFEIKEYLHLEQFDKVVMASLIESANVIGEDRLEA